MKKNKYSLFLTIVAALFIISCSKGDNATAGSKDGGKHVKWYSFNEGIKLAKKQNKPIVIDFYADWCKWCKVMEKETFADSEVAKELKNNFIPIRVDTQDTSQTIDFNSNKLSVQQFSGMMGVQGLPTLIFMDKNGKPITKIPGFVRKDVFLPLLKYINEGCYIRNISFADFKSGKSPCGNGKKK